MALQSKQIHDIKVDNIHLVDHKSRSILLHHIFEEEYPYDETKIPDFSERCILNMLSDHHNIKIRIVYICDFKITYRYYKCISPNTLQRVIVHHKERPILVFSRSNVRLLETLINEKNAKIAINLLITQGLTELSNYDGNWLEVDDF